MAQHWPRVLCLAFLLLLGRLTLNCSSSPPERQGEKQIVTDEIGRQVEISKNPQRIISLAPNVTEMLFALGLGDRVVGVTSYCDYPVEARSKEKMGDVLNPNLERIVALTPDLVIISTATQLERFAQRLADLRVPFYVVDAKRVESVLDSLKHLGEITGRLEQAEKIIGELQARLDRIRRLTSPLPRPRVLIVVQRDPLIVPGRQAFLNDVVEKAGGESITSDAEREWTLYSLETVIAKAPEVIILPSGEAKTRQLGDVQWRELARTPALRRQQVYTINTDLLMRPGPRLIDGLEELAHVLHPEAFK